MNKYFRIKNCWLLVLLVALTSLLSMAVQAQGTTPEEKKKKYAEWLEQDVSWLVEDTPALKLKLTTLTPLLCIDSPLMLELEITNISQEEVAIGKGTLWTSFSYSFDAQDGAGRGGGMGINNSLGRGEKIVLAPGMSYRSTHEFSIAFDFFQDAGNYTLKTQLDSIFSNEVKFELYDCGKAQKVEEQK